MNASRLRPNAPKVRTVDELYRKHEQLLDAAEHGRMKPQDIIAMSNTLKQMKALGLDLPILMMKLIAKCKESGAGVPKPRGEMLRSFLELKERADE